MNKILYMAPMRGLTSFTFRNTFIKFFKGFDLAVAPFIPSVSSRKIKDSYLNDVLPENNPGMNVIPQILSKSPEDFIFLAKRLYDIGHKTVNLNLGCPFAAVAKKKRGSGMLPYPEMIDEFLEKVIPAIPNALSVKTRLGRHKADEIFNLMPVFNAYPIKELIIHPRTGIQMYEGVPDLDTFEQCLPLSLHPVAYNGDINNMSAFQSLSERFPLVNKWMIGRGALINPFLPEIIKTGNDIRTDKIKIFKEFHDELFHEFGKILSGSAHLVDRMKGFWYYFSQSFTNSRKFVKKIHKMRDAEDYINFVHRFFDEEAEWEDKP